MWQDPIVKEVRQAGKELERKANNSIHIFFENLRKAEPNYPGKIVKKTSRA